MPARRFGAVAIGLAILSLGAPAAPGSAAEPLPAMVCPPDAAEPNDTSPAAFPIACTATYRLPVAPTCLTPPGDVDFFAVDLAAGQSLSLYYGGGSVGDGLTASFYDLDGITLLEARRLAEREPFATTAPATGTYFFSLSSASSATGDYSLMVRCRDVVTVPPDVGNTLMVVKRAGDIVLTWDKPSDAWLDPPTSYDLWRALASTTLFYQPLATTSATVYSPGPLTSRPAQEFYRVRSRNAMGAAGPVPSFARIELTPDAVPLISSAFPASANPCDAPNLHPDLPFAVTLTVTDRAGAPLDGYLVRILAGGSIDAGTFCPPGPDPLVSEGWTGSAGPGAYRADFSLSDTELRGCPFASFCESWFRGDSDDFGLSWDTAMLQYQ